MAYTESGVRLRRRSTRVPGFYKILLVTSLIANAVFALSFWGRDVIVIGTEKVQTILAFLTMH